MSISPNNLLSASQLSKLRWRCRRGLLENDLFIERFFEKYQIHLSHRHALGLQALMDLSDNDLLDLFIGRVQFDPQPDQAEMAEVLSMFRTLTNQPAHPITSHSSKDAP